MWKPQLGPVDETPYKIDRADIVLEDLVNGLRGDLALLEAQFEKVSAAGSMTPATEALYRKKIARTKYQLWARTLDHTLIPSTVDSYTLALAFPANNVQPILWWEAANLYLSQGAYEGALALFNRIFMDFADYNRITSVLMCRAATYRRVYRFEEAVKDFLAVIQKKIPEPYTFSDIMVHVAWCYELMADSTDKKFYAEEARGAFATAYQSMKEKPADSMVMFGKDISDKSADWAIWRRTPMTWLRLGKKHSEAGHIVLSADCFNEAGRLRELQNIQEAADKAAADAVRKKQEEEAAIRKAAEDNPVLSPFQRMMQANAAAKARAAAAAEAKAAAAAAALRNYDDESTTDESDGSSESSGDDEEELEKQQDERWAMEDEEKLSKAYEIICIAEASKVPAAARPPTMRIDPPEVPQPATKWRKGITFDELVRSKIMPKVRRKSAVEEAGLWMVASDVYLREDRNEAAHIAAEAAVRGAKMGDITASAALSLLAKGSTELSILLQKRAAAHLLSLSTRWVHRVRTRIRQREATRLIMLAYRQYRYRVRHYARVMIQSRVKAFLVRVQFRRMRAATPPIQCWWRMLLAVWEKCRIQRTRVRWALLILQRNIRWFVHRTVYQEWLVATVRIQRAFREFQARVRAFIWERYLFFAAQELEHWVGCNVGCIIVPKKFVRHYEPNYRIPVKASDLNQHASLPSLNLAALTVPKRKLANAAVTALSKSRSASASGEPSYDDEPAPEPPVDKDRVVWLHPEDRIVHRRVIPTRIEMLAEIRVWGRAEHIAEMIAFADVNVQQGAVWGYNDGEPELEEWGGFRTLYLQMRAFRSHRVVGKDTTDPDSILKDGGESIRAKARREAGLSSAKHRSRDAPSPEPEHRELLKNPGVVKVRTWMQQLKHGVLPTWNRGLPAVWEAFTTGKGTQYYKEARKDFKFESPHVCAEPMLPVKVSRTVVRERSLELAADAPKGASAGIPAPPQPDLSGSMFEEPETISMAPVSTGVFRSALRQPKLEFTRSLASTGGAGSTIRSLTSTKVVGGPKNPVVDGTAASEYGSRPSDKMLTPTVFVKVGVSHHFQFECAGRWGCDLKNWTKGSERYLWDLNLWTESNIWDFPYASMDQFVLVQRWLSQLPVEVRVWAKKGKDWRSLLDEQLQTGTRFLHRSYLNALRECVAKRVFGDDTSGWYAGWVPRHRSGVVHGAVGPSVSQARAMSAATGDADVSEEDSDDPDVRLARESAAVSDDALVSLPAIAMKQTRARIGAISPAVGAMSTSRSVASNTSKASKKTSATLARSSSHATLTTPSGKHEGSRKPSSAKAARSALGSSAKQQSVSESAVSPMSRSPSRRSTARRTGRTAFVEPVDAGPVHPGSLVRYQHTLVVRHEEASALVRQYIETAFEDQPVNRGTLCGPWLIEGLAEVIAAVHSCEGMLAPVLAGLKRRSLRWYTMQLTALDGDKLRMQAHEARLRDIRAERVRVVKSVREERNKRAQEPAVRLAIYRRHKDASQGIRLYKELIQTEARRRNWSDIIEILQAVSDEPLFRGTTVYLAAALASALKCAGDVAVNRGLESDGTKFSDAKPHADWDGGYGNPDEINMLIQVETGSAGTFTSASLAVTVLGWATKHLIHLERESFCDALRATTIPGGWKDAMFVYKAMKQAGHSMAAPVFDIMTLVCRNTFGKQRPKLYEALKSAGASYALCFMAANSDGI